jgi:hypothetical protein
LYQTGETVTQLTVHLHPRHFNLTVVMKLDPEMLMEAIMVVVLTMHLMVVAMARSRRTPVEKGKQSLRRSRDMNQIL